MEKQDVMYRHTKPNSRGKRSTFAAVMKDKVMHIGVAHCNPNDQFNRAIGRNIALSRANNSPITTIHVEHEERIKDTFHISCETILNIKK